MVEPVFCGGPAIAGKHDGAQAFPAEFFQDLPGLRPDVVAKDHAAKKVAFGKPDFREAGRRSGNLADERGAVALAQPIAAAHVALGESEAGSAAAASAQAVASDGLELSEFDGL